MNNNNENNENNNKMITSQEIGVGCSIGDNNFMSIDDYNYIINYGNKNSQENDINEQIKNEEEDEEEEGEEEEEENEDDNNNLIEKENFSQQVDFLYHPDNPEYLPPKKNNQKKIIKKSKSTVSSKKSKLKKSKSKSKNKAKNKNKKNQFINKIRPEFNLCTKIDPKPKTESLFYGPRNETRYEKQCKERAQKIAEYEENYWRQKEIYKAKRKREEQELKNRHNYIKSRTSNNFYPINQSKKEKNDDEFLKLFKNITKVDYPNADIRKYECNPQKYDAIIHSLLSEISEIKFQRKKENEHFVNEIKRLQNDLDDNKLKKNKKRPQTGNKTKNNKSKAKNKNSLNNIINNYYNPNKKRAKTGNKLKNKNNVSYKKKGIENEIPVSENNSKNNTKNYYYISEKERILKNIEDLERQKNNKINEILEQRNKANENNNNNLNNNNLDIFRSNVSSNNDNIYNSKNKYISKSVNVYQAPIYSNNNNIYNNIDKRILNYQDQMQILTELNNNISKFTSGIPKLVNKVNQTLDKIYGNTDNPIKKAINNHPFVILASKSAFQMIQNNHEILIENIIDDLLIDCIFDLEKIEKARKELLEKEKFYEYINQAREALKIVRQKEKEILNKY